MLRCVQLCYDGDELSQGDAAKELGFGTNISRVSRLLKRAREEGYVRVTYEFPELPKLALGLIEKYGLRDAVVIQAGEERFIKRDIGQTIARYFERKIATDNQSVGLSCGRTLYHFVENLQEKRFKGLQIYPLSHDMTVELVDLFPETLVGMMAAKYRPDVKAYAFQGYLLRPGKLVRGSLAKRVIDQNRAAFNSAKSVDVAILGIGSISTEPDIPGFRKFAGLCGVPAQDLERHAAGEFNYQPFDKEGNPVTVGKLKRLIEQTMAVRLEDFQKLAADSGKRVIAGAGGANKVETIRAALKGKFFNVLVTDHRVAKRLLEPESTRQ